MASRARARPMPDSYFELVRAFPLAHLRDDDHLEEAQEVVDRLLREDRDEGAEAYLDALTDLIEVYEGEHYAIPDVPEADVLRLLMESNGLSQQRLAKAAGIAQSTLSAVLNGGRTLTRDHMIRLARVFGVPPAVFLPA